MNSGFSDFITAKCSQTKHDIHFLIDTEADISILKISNLRDVTNIDKSGIIPMKGITSQRINSIGSLKLNLVFNHLNIEHIIYIVSDDFPIPCSGILGKDFLKRHHCLIDLSEMSISIRT